MKCPNCKFEHSWYYHDYNMDKDILADDIPAILAENKKLRDGIDKIVAGIRMNIKIKYVLIMMDELDALKEGE